MRRGRAYHVWDVFFFLICFWVVLSCSVFVQKKPIKPKKPKNLKTFFKNLGFSSPAWRSLEVAPFGRLHTSFYSSSTVTMVVSRTVLEINRGRQTPVFLPLPFNLHDHLEPLRFLSRVSTLTRDIDIAILSVRLSVCPSRSSIR